MGLTDYSGLLDTHLIVDPLTEVWDKRTGAVCGGGLVVYASEKP